MSFVAQRSSERFERYLHGILQFVLIFCCVGHLTALVDYGCALELLLCPGFMDALLLFHNSIFEYMSSI